MIIFWGWTSLSQTIINTSLSQKSHISVNCKFILSFAGSHRSFQPVSANIKQISRHLVKHISFVIIIEKKIFAAKIVPMLVTFVVRCFEFVGICFDFTVKEEQTKAMMCHWSCLTFAFISEWSSQRCWEICSLTFITVGLTSSFWSAPCQA